MPLWALMLLCVGVVAFTIAIHAALLWLGGKLWHVKDLRYRRALLAAIVLFIVGLVLQLGIAYTLLSLPSSPPADPGELPSGWSAVTTVALAGLGLWLVVIWWVLKRILRTTAGKAALTALTMLIPGAALGFVGAMAIRTWMVEAFVVPMGSMAPTLVGAHGEVTCRHCGRPYAVGLSSVAESPPGVLDEPVTSRCPNCAQTNEIPPGTSILSGDRILVDKTAEPRRWELVVFRVPGDPSVSYVKRLVGLPGEKLEILAGDVFVNDRRLPKPPGEADEMWLLVHNSQYVPQPPREDATGWVASTDSWQRSETGWMCDATDGEERDLAFEGLTVQRPYNPMTRWDEGNPLSAAIADVRLRVHIDELAGEGDLQFGWQLGPQRLIGAISSTGKLELTSEGADWESLEPERGELLRPLESSPWLAFVIRDGQAWIGQEGKPLVSVQALPDSIEDARALAEDVNESCRLWIRARGCRVGLSQILLDRDIYHATPDEMGVQQRDLENARAGDRIELTAGEFFVLGDNSFRSKDSRLFGPVHESALLGVARWIYWPPQRWQEFR